MLVIFLIAFGVLFVIGDVFGLSVRWRGIKVNTSDIPISLFLAIGTSVLATTVNEIPYQPADGVFHLEIICNVSMNFRICMSEQLRRIK